MMKTVVFAVIVLAGSMAQARIVPGGGSDSPKNSRQFTTNGRALRECLLASIRRHISASRLPDMAIREETLSVSSCWIDDCVKARFTAYRDGIGYDGMATLTVAKLDNAGEPGRCQVYHRESNSLEDLTALTSMARNCNRVARKYLTIVSPNNVVVVDGCARVD